MNTPQTTLEDLPREILHEIFSAFMGPRTGGASDHSRRRRLVLLSHTCQAWRVQTIATPSLWADVLILGTSKLYFSFFHRSSPLAVNLTIVLPNTMPLEGDSSVGAMIVRFLRRSFEEEPELLPRIQSFRLVLQGGDQASFTMDSFDFGSSSTCPPLKWQRSTVSSDASMTHCKWGEFDVRLKDK